MSVKIQPEAQISITQTCADCRGEGVVGMTTFCTECGHVFSQAELEQESHSWPLYNEKQSCGCAMTYRNERVNFCTECESDGIQNLSITLSELAEALATPMAAALAKQVAIRTSSRML